jgi:hypothetical protein
MVIRIRYRHSGGHVDCRVFTAKGTAFTFAKAGDLCFAENEWNDIRDSLQGVVDFVDDQAPEPERPLTPADFKTWGTNPPVRKDGGGRQA